MATLRNEETTDFSFGMDDSSAATAFARKSVRLLLNGRIEPDGTVSRRPGTRRTHAAASHTGVGFGAFEFRAANGNVQLLKFIGNRGFVSDGPVYDTWDELLQQGVHVVAGLAISGTAAQFQTTAEATYVIAITEHTKAAVDNLTFSAADTIDADKFGAWLVQIDAAGAITTKPAAAAMDYDTAALALAALPAPDAGNARLGTIEVAAGAGGFTANTTALTGVVTFTDAAIAVSLRQDYYTFATMRVGAVMYLFAANGDATVKRWDGTTWDTLPNAPAGLKFVAVFNGRLYGAGHSGVLIQASRIADPTHWASPFGITIQAITHSGNPITGIYQIASHLLVFDRAATAYVDGNGEQTMIVATGATGFSRSVGCVAFRSITAVGDNAVCWLSERGVEYYTPGGGIRLVSRRVQGFLNNLDRTLLAETPGRPSAAYDESRQEYHLALSSAGTRNDRTLVINLLQDPLVGKSGLRAAAAIDTQLESEADLLFEGDADGYLTTPVGYQLRPGFQGYAALASEGQSGDPTTEDADGYLTTSTNDTLPATLFIATLADVGPVIHSLGYDGFVRRHFLADRDNMAADGTGGAPVTMTVVSRPFLFGSPRVRKRVRAVHVSAIAAATATMTVQIRARGTLTTSQVVTVSATAYDQPRRRRLMVSAIGDSPQVEVYTTDAIRIALIGASAELMREPVT